MLRIDPGAVMRSARGGAMRLGFDLVQISQVEEALRRFGPAYEGKLFTNGECAYARSSHASRAERYAARLAAKEAVMKALGLGNAGVGWRDIEVLKADGGACEIALHGRAAALARDLGAGRILLSLSHDGDYAGAFVSVLPASKGRCDCLEAPAP